ncbi:TolC family protein [Rubrivirga sp. S365]|uniref:TolC family protein n=1 Tax=Rubrivirga sp. S365 TaxID=3076080 RepID=UPI0028CACD23|nr:TolC family protein [Rubrivirga sp. S365]MDT7855045.1 TolC family protein [Rubrivirga sp. S365]
MPAPLRPGGPAALAAALTVWFALAAPAPAQTTDPPAAPPRSAPAAPAAVGGAVTDPARFPDRATALPALDAGGAVVSLSLDDAIQIALQRAYAIRLAELDVANARAQVREAYGGLFPLVDVASSYTRNVVQANPFAGSAAGGLFGGLGAIGWLQYNEVARTDGDPTTETLTLTEYNRRVLEGQQAIGFDPAAESGNPFGTDNQFLNTLSLSQPIYNGSAFAAVRGARGLVEINEAAVEQRRDETIHQARVAYYGALLAGRQAAVQRASVERARETFEDASLLVAQGVRPVLERLNAEVDLANAETQLAQADAQASTARDQLLLALGLPVTAPVVLESDLAPPRPALFQTVGLAAAAATALDLRPDVRQAALAVRLNEVQRDITRAAAYPRLSAFATASYSGNVPDDRTAVFAPDPRDPFTFTESSSGFFSGDYWQPSLAVGVRLGWTLFDGFQTRYRAQQDQIVIDQAQVQLEQVRNAAQLEVATAIRQLQSAQSRLGSQSQTVETAQTAFAFASARLEEGVASQVDVRVATQNLDLARLNYLQAVYDALVARSDYERATGTILPAPLDETVRPAPPTAAR